MLVFCEVLVFEELILLVGEVLLYKIELLTELEEFKFVIFTEIELFILLKLELEELIKILLFWGNFIKVKLSRKVARLSKV